MKYIYTIGVSLFSHGCGDNNKDYGKEIVLFGTGKGQWHRIN